MGEEVCQPGTGYLPPGDRKKQWPAAKSRRELIDLWYIKPLKKMVGHEAFICLPICFLLYEKYLRKKGLIEPDENFSQAFNRLFLPCTEKQYRSDVPLLTKLIKAFVKSGVRVKLHPDEVIRVKELLKK